jgi:hypothetical protein
MKKSFFPSKTKRTVEKHSKKDYNILGKPVNKNVYDLQILYETKQMNNTNVLPEFVEKLWFFVVRGLQKETRNNQIDTKGDLWNYVWENLLHKLIPTYTVKSKQYTYDIIFPFWPESVDKQFYLLNKGQVDDTYLLSEGTYKSVSKDINGNKFTLKETYKLSKDFTQVVCTQVIEEYVIKYKRTKTNIGSYVLNNCFWLHKSWKETKDFYNSQLSDFDFLEDYSNLSDKNKVIDFSNFKFITQVSNSLINSIDIQSVQGILS